MGFHPDTVLQALPGPGDNICIAYSGGMDSQVLLHALASLREAGKITGTITAIHINHGLNANANDWAEHCRKQALQLDIPLQIVDVQVEKQGQGLEQAARDARYRVFGELLPSESDVLLTAHHQDDQAETLLFRLLRGTGIRGLGGIKARRPLGNGMLVRPLLGNTREELLDYARQHALQWVEDDSNGDVSLDRNYLRHQVLPVIQARWPGYRKNLHRLGEFAIEAQELMAEIGTQDLVVARDGVHRLAIKALAKFSLARQHNVVRSWFLDLESVHGIPAPDSYVIERIFTELIPAADDAEPLISWQKDGRQMEVRRFADRIYMVLPIDEPVMPSSVIWQADTPLDLPGQGRLALEETKEEGFVLPDDGKLEIRFRQGGEAAKPAGRKTRSLKKVLQDYQVPPWLRSHIPLVYCEGELLAVGDLFITDKWRVLARDAGGKKMYAIRWFRADLHCGY